MVAKEATRKAYSNGPHRAAQSRRSAPNNSNGVASWRDSNCIDFAAVVPPGANTPMLARKKVIAMAVTGGPSNRPILVVFPNSCETVAVPASVAQLPHMSVAGTRGGDGSGNLEARDDVSGVRDDVEDSLEGDLNVFLPFFHLTIPRRCDKSGGIGLKAPDGMAKASSSTRRQALLR